MFNQLALTAAGTLTMSSREIADRTAKRHDHVMADCRVMLEALGIGDLKFQATYRTAQGKAALCYNLPKRECLILVSGYPKPVSGALSREQAKKLEHFAGPRRE